MTIGQGNFKDPVDRWVKVTDALWGMVPDNPSVAPAIYSWTIAKQDGGASVSERENPIKSGSRMGREVKRFKERFFSVWSRWPKEKCDVLFVPNSARSNYLGACMTAAEALYENAPEIKTGFVWPTDIIPDHSKDAGQIPFNYYKFNKGYLFSIPLLLKSFQLLGQIRNRIKQDKQLSRWFAEEGALKKWRKICSSLFAVHFARRWLRNVGCSLVITPNEQWVPGSTLVAAARIEGIHTCQFLHGMAARFYWPFLSDEFWLWGPWTRRTLHEFGAPLNRLKVLGSLEFAGRPPQPTKLRAGLKTCLFLSQWHGRKILGERGYNEILNWIAFALAEEKDRWRLLIRWHPNDEKDGLEVHEGLFSGYGVDVNYSEYETGLEEDVMRADFVCTQSSTAILMSLKLRVPCALLWAQEHFRNLGEPYLEPPFLATNSSELRKALSGEIKEEDYRKSIHHLLGDPEATEKNVSRRITEILSCQRRKRSLSV